MKNNPPVTVFSRSVFMIICLLVCLTPLARGGSPYWAKTLVQLSALAGLMVLIMEAVFTGIRAVPKSSLNRPLAAIILLALISTFVSGNIALSFEGLAMLCAYLAVYFLTIAAVRTRQEQRRLMTVFLATAVLLSVFGLFKRYGFNPFPFWAYTPWYPGMPLTSVYPNHNHMAGLLEMAIPLLLVSALAAEKGLPWRVFLAYLTVILLIAHLFTLSRGGWIALAGAMSFLVAVSVRTGRLPFRRAAVMAAVWAAVLLVVVFSFTPVSRRLSTMTEGNPALTIRDRMTVWGGVVNMIADHPLAGTGPGTFAQRFPAYQPPGFDRLFTSAHNDYLHFVAETGLLLIPLLAWLTYAFFKKGFDAAGRKEIRNANYILAVMAAAVAVMIHSLVDFNLHIPANAVIFAVLCATLETDLPDRGKGRT